MRWVLHFEKTSQSMAYTVNARALGCVIEQRDLRVPKYSFLKVVTRVDRVMRKAFVTLLPFIGQGIEDGSWDIMLQPAQNDSTAVFGVMCAVMVILL